MTKVLSKYCYVYVLRSLKDDQFYVGLTRDLPLRLQQHNSGLVISTKKRTPFELVYWEGCLNRSDAAQRREISQERMGQTLYQNSIATLSHGVKDVSTTMIYTHVPNRPGIGVKSPLD